jgi:hypothetical protein
MEARDASCLTDRAQESPGDAATQQAAQQFRHYGPVAQEFVAAFGQDAVRAIGTPTTINSGDLDLAMVCMRLPTWLQSLSPAQA